MRVIKKRWVYFLWLVFVTHSGFAQTLSDGRYTIYSRHSGLVLDVAGGSSADGANIQQWGYAGSSNQHFDVRYEGNGYYSIISASSGKAIEVYNFNSDPGGEIRQWEYWNGDNQLWLLTHIDGEFFTATSKYSGLNLDVWNWSTASGGDIRQWNATGALNQQFRFERIDNSTEEQVSCDKPNHGGRHLIINYSSGKSLDITSASGSDGANAIQWRKTGGENQAFFLERVGNSEYWTIKPAHSGRALEVAGAATNNGANIQQWAYSGNGHQQWRLLKSNNFNGAYAIVNVNSGKSLTVAGGNDGDNIYQNSDAAVSSQRWYITPLDNGCGSSSGSSSSSSSGTPNYAQGVDGFAAQYGADGLATTTGGGNATPVTISSCAQLQQLAEDNTSKTLILPNRTLDCRSANRSQRACVLSCGNGISTPLYRVATSSQSCADLGGSDSNVAYLNKNESTIRVGSNTTIVGAGRDAKVIGGSFGLGNASNVILKNFAITEVNAGIIEAGDAISLNNSSHVWIDHMRLSKISDGLLDSYDSRNITVSWSHFDGVNTELCWGTDPYVSLLQNTEATFHHNFFDSGYGRNPKIGGSASRVHMYNNYWKDIYYFSMSVSDGARAKVEGNYYQNANRPHWNDGGYIDANTGSNRYTGRSVSSSQDDSGESSWDVSLYNYIRDSADNLPSTLPSAVGPQ